MRLGRQGDPDAETGTVSEYSDDEVDRHVSQTELARIEINRYAHEHQNRANAKNKAKYDKAHRVGDSVIAVGDLVLKKVTQLSGKMHGRVAAKWEGPFEVVATTKCTAHLNQGGGIAKGVSYHILKKYHVPTAEMQLQRPCGVLYDPHARGGYRRVLFRGRPALCSSRFSWEGLRPQRNLFLVRGRRRNSRVRPPYGASGVSHDFRRFLRRNSEVAALLVETKRLRSVRV